MPDHAKNLASALALHRAGRMEQAHALYRQILADEPDNADAMNLLGILLDQTGQALAAIDMLRRAVAAQPRSPHFYVSLSAALTHAGQMPAAADTLKQALALDPSSAAVHSNLGNILQQQGRAAEAQAAYRSAIAADPTFADAHFNLGMLLLEQGQIAEALACFPRVIDLQPQAYDAWQQFAAILTAQGRHADAMELHERAVAANPHLPQAYEDLAAAMGRAQLPAHAIAAVRDARNQQTDPAQQSLALARALADAHATGPALEAARHAAAARPDWDEPWILIADLLRDAGQLDESQSACDKALTFNPVSAQAHRSLGLLRKDQGRIADAVTANRRALELDPASPEIHSTLLMALQYLPGHTSEENLRQHQIWNQRHALSLAVRARPHTASRHANRPLRIGYVSADFSSHVVGLNLLPLFRHHDRDRVAITCYSAVRSPDKTTEIFRRLVPTWRDITSASDSAVCDLIVSDAIDILVDLSLHTRGNRLLVFAQKPAPVQITFAGYPGTTGVSGIDWRLTDPHLDPPGRSDSCYTEASFRIPSFWCYDGTALEPAVAPLPADSNSHITFGCLNNFCKVNPQSLALWAAIMRQVPNSRLLLLTGQGRHRSHTLTLLQSHGIDPDRIEFTSRLDRAAYLRAHSRVDIALDTLPYNGHTTSLDALWMGAPVVTFVGSTVVGRAGLSQLTNLGLPELVAHTDADFVRIATSLAGDILRLRQLRLTLRDRLLASPLTDAPAFAQAIESAYVSIWSASGQPTVQCAATKEPK